MWAICVADCFKLKNQISFFAWGLFDRASSSWNKVKCQLDATRWFYWYILSSTCFWYIRPSSGALNVEFQHIVFCTEFADGAARRTAPSAPYTRPTQRLSRPPSIHKLGAENHTLQLNIKCSWWWAYVPETCRAKNTSIKLTSCIKMGFHFISAFFSV